MLTRLSTRKVEIPGEEGAWAEIKPASRRDVELVREAGLRKITEKAALMQGVEDLLADVTPEEVREIRQTARSNPLAGIDITVLLSRCIVAWSYEAEITEETVDDLDEATARFLAEQIWLRGAEAGKAVS